MDYKKKAVKRIEIVLISTILAAFFSYLVRMILARKLTPSEYGLFFAIFTLISLLKLFKYLGLGQALVKYIPEFQVKNEQKLIKDAIVTVVIFNLISAIIISSILIISSKFLANNYFNNPLAVVGLWIFSAIFIVDVFKQNLKDVFNGFQKITTFSLMHLFENIIIVIFILVFFYMNLEILAPFFAYLIANIILIILFIPLFLRIYPFFKYKFKLSKKLTNKLFRFGIPITISGLGGIIILYTDTLILTYFATLEEVGIYNVIVPTAMLLYFFAISVHQVIFPMVSEIKAKGLNEYIYEAIQLLQKYSFAIIVPVALIMFSFPRLIIQILFGKEYLGSMISLFGKEYFISALTLQILVIGLIFLVIGTIHISILNGLGKPKLVTRIYLTAAGFNLLTNFYFIPKLGLLGASITSFVSYLIIMILSLFYLGKSIRFKIPWSSWIKIFISGCVLVILISVLKVIINLNVYIEAFICISFSMLVYVLLLFILKVTKFNEIKELFLKNLI